MTPEQRANKDWKPGISLRDVMREVSFEGSIDECNAYLKVWETRTKAYKFERLRASLKEKV